jgi:hypothetical protein
VALSKAAKADGLRYETHCNGPVLQVTGFTVNPDKPGMRFVRGKLVPYESQNKLGDANQHKKQ